MAVGFPLHSPLGITRHPCTRTSRLAQQRQRSVRSPRLQRRRDRARRGRSRDRVSVLGFRGRAVLSKGARAGAGAQPSGRPVPRATPPHLVIALLAAWSAVVRRPGLWSSPRGVRCHFLFRFRRLSPIRFCRSVAAIDRNRRRE